MGKPPLPDNSGVDIRAELIAKYRHMIESRPHFAGTGPWPAIVRALEAGEARRFPKWQLPKRARELLPLGGANDWYELGTDGSLTPVDGPLRRKEHGNG